MRRTGKGRISTRSAAVLVAVAVGMLATAASATAQNKPLIPPSNVGTGVLSGKVEFTTPSLGIPGALETCVPATAQVQASAPVIVVNTVLTGYVGPVAITAVGTSTCENAEQGQGTLEIEAHGVGPTGSRLDCGPFAEKPDQDKLVGVYVRVGAAITVQASGECTINKFAIANVTFVSEIGAAATKDDPSTPTVDNWETQIGRAHV
jgi:hypothetical protein